MSPRDPSGALFRYFIGDSEMGLGHIDAAIAEFRKAIDLGQRGFFVYTDLAAANALSGKMDEAQAPLAEARRLNPAITVKWMKERAVTPAIIDGLRKAGLPEECKRCEHTLACPGCSGGYVTRANRLGIQNWRMASTAAGMSRHAS